MILYNDLAKLNGPPDKNKLVRQKILNYIKILNLTDAYRELHPNVKGSFKMRWEALKCFLRDHTINYSCRKKKMLSVRQDALENLIKYEETNLLTTNDIQTTLRKISFYQNELENLVQNRTKGAIVKTRARWAKNGEKNIKYFLKLEKETMIKSHP